MNMERRLLPEKLQEIRDIWEHFYSQENQPALLRLCERLGIFDQFSQENYEEIFDLLDQIKIFIEEFRQSTSFFDLWKKVFLDNSYRSVVFKKLSSFNESIDEYSMRLLPSVTINFEEEYNLDLSALETQLDVVVNELSGLGGPDAQELVNFVRSLDQMQVKPEVLQEIEELKLKLDARSDDKDRSLLDNTKNKNMGKAEKKEKKQQQKQNQKKKSENVIVKNDLKGFFKQIKEIKDDLSTFFNEQRQDIRSIRDDLIGLLNHLKVSDSALNSLGRKRYSFLEGAACPSNTIQSVLLRTNSTESHSLEPKQIIALLTEQVSFLSLRELVRLREEVRSLVSAPSLLALPVELVRLVLSFLSTSNLYRLDTAMTTRRFRVDWRSFMSHRLTEIAREIHSFREGFVRKKTITPNEKEGEIRSDIFSCGSSLYFLNETEGLVICNVNSCKRKRFAYLEDDYQESEDDYEPHENEDEGVSVIYQMSNGRLIFGHKNGKINLINILPYRRQYRREWVGRVPRGSPVSCLKELKDGRLVSGSENGTIAVWDVKLGALLFSLGGDEDDAFETMDGIRCILPLPDGERIVTSSFMTELKIWNLTTKQCERTFAAHTDSIHCLIRLTDGRYVSAGDDESIHIWSADWSYCEQTLTWRGCCNSDCLLQLIDGRLAAANVMGDFMVWDVQTGELSIQQSFSLLFRSLNQLPDGRIVAGVSHIDTMTNAVELLWPKNH